MSKIINAKKATVENVMQVLEDTYGANSETVKHFRAEQVAKGIVWLYSDHGIFSGSIINTISKHFEIVGVSDMFKLHMSITVKASED